MGIGKLQGFFYGVEKQSLVLKVLGGGGEKCWRRRERKRRRRGFGRWLGRQMMAEEKGFGGLGFKEACWTRGNFSKGFITEDHTWRKRNYQKGTKLRKYQSKIGHTKLYTSCVKGKFVNICYKITVFVLLNICVRKYFLISLTCKKPLWHDI